MPHIELADLNNPIHCAGILHCLDAYASDPMGCAAALPSDVKDSLIDGLKQHAANLCLLAVHEAQIIGIALCMISYSTFRARPRLNVHDLTVLPTHRGRGIGRQLLQAVIDHAAQNDYCQVTLEVRQDNPRAQALYQSMGFSGGEAPMEFWVKAVATA